MSSLLVGACGHEGEVELRVSLDHVPLVGLEVAALPYDADRILDSLARAATTPRPDFSSLEAELRTYQRKDPDSITALNAEWAEARQTVADLAGTLHGMERGSAEYAEAYRRFRSAYDGLSREEAELEGRMRRELGADRELAVRAGAAADSLRRWEENAYRAFPELVAEYESVTLVTDSLGRVHASLEPGPWWFVARRPDPENPFMEIIWRVPVVVSSLVPVTTPLSDHNVTFRWRR
jgi:hypothetical protein